MPNLALALLEAGLNDLLARRYEPELALDWLVVAHARDWFGDGHRVALPFFAFGGYRVLYMTDVLDAKEWRAKAILLRNELRAA